jgi:hypothetical protein
MKKENLRLISLVLLGFILTSIIGSLTIEGTRVLIGKNLGYESSFVKGLGIYLFSNPDISEGFDKIEATGLPFEELKKRNDWISLRKQNQDNQAIIEASGILMSAILTILGILFLMRGRSKTTEMKLINWIGFLTSLIFVRYLVRYSYTLYFGSITCQEFSIFQSLGIGSFLSIYILFGLGIILAFWIVYQLPKNLRLLTIISGMIGGFLGLIIWMNYLGPIYD